MPRDQRNGDTTSSLAHIDRVAAPAIAAVAPDGIQRGESTQTFVAARIDNLSRATKFVSQKWPVLLLVFRLITFVMS
jgi:hypothetical protein